MILGLAPPRLYAGARFASFLQMLKYERALLLLM
jgi:hypothetical protein